MDKMKCDVVIVGSGIGAMCAAVKLSKAGVRPVVLESMPELGGRFRHVEHKGCLITTGAWYIGWGKDGPVWSLLQESGGREIETQPLDLFKYQIEGNYHDIWLTKTGGLQNIVSKCSRSKEETDKVMTALRRALRWNEPSDSISFRDWFLQYSDSEVIYDMFLTQSAAWCGINLHEFPAGEFFRCLRESSIRGGTLVLKNGVTEVIDILEKEIKNNGGELIKNAKVTEIVVKDGVAEGVIVQKDSSRIHVEAEHVISNVGPVRTIELAKEQNFDIGYLKEVRDKIKPSVGVYVVFTSDKPLLDFRGMLYACDTRRPHIWADMTIYYPDYAPKGKHLTYGFSLPDNALVYDRRKELELFFQDAKDLFPNFDQCGAEMIHWCNFYGSWPLTRGWPGYMIGTKTSIQNLYSVGDAHNPPGYMFGEGAAESGIRVAEEIKKARKAV